MAAKLPHQLHIEGSSANMSARRGKRTLGEDSMDQSQSSQSAKKRIQNFFKKKPYIKLWSPPDCYTIAISGLEVSLPRGLQPYSTQKLMMVRIIQAVQKCQNALMESPTGSGKTMALLASSCAWLRDYIKRRNQSKTTCPAHGQHEPSTSSRLPPILTSNSSALNTPVRGIDSKFKDDDEVSVVYDSFDRSMQKLTEEMDDDFVTPKKVDSPNAALLARLHSLHEEEEAEMVEEDSEAAKEKKEKCTCLPRVRIYYGTRTHKQIAQVIKEFGRLNYAPDMKHTILGSREQMCVNEHVRKHSDVGSACKEVISQNGIGCTFKLNMRGSFERSYNIRNMLTTKGTGVWDIEELVQALGDDDRTPLCPYFSATRVLTQDADIIFCPFNYLIDPIIRDSSDVHLKDAVIILDEAHNVEDSCRDAVSFTFTEKELHDSLSSVQEKKDMVNKSIRQTAQQSAHNSEGEENELEEFLSRMRDCQRWLQTMSVILNEMKEWMVDVSSNVSSPRENDRFGRATVTKGWEDLWISLHDSTHSRRLLFEVDGVRYKEVKEAVTKLAEKDFANPENTIYSLDPFKPSGTALVTLEKFMYFHGFFTKENKRSMYRLNVVVERPSDQQLAMETMHGRRHGDGGGPKNLLYSQGMELWGGSDRESVNNSFVPPLLDFLDSRAPPYGFTPIRHGFRVSVHLWCMSPELAFMDAFENARSVVLASGTLCPTETLKTELGVPFQLEMEGEQVIPRDQIFAAVVQRGPGGGALRATYQNTNGDDKFIDELSRIVRSVAWAVPSGVLVFLPSYRMLDRLFDYMTRASMLRQVEMRKVVVKEPRRSSELTDIMAKYEAAVADPKQFGPQVTGALMFAVFRGKVSEGIDFADDRARCVVSVGIPYPNAFDELVLEKKKYNNENCTKQRILNGDQWYTSQAYRALNQALGRCLRHRGDWGAIVMVDERLANGGGGGGFRMDSSTASAARVSKWIREQMTAYTHYNEFEDHLKSFVKQRTMLGGVKQEVKQEIM